MAHPNPAVLDPQQGETIQLGPTRLRILEDGHLTDHHLGLIEITLAPRTDGPPQHVHAAHAEGFYVVSGAATFVLGESRHAASAGSFVMVPAGAPHTFANPTDSPTVILNTFTPDVYVQYFRDLSQHLSQGQPPNAQTTIETMRKYATYPATGPNAQPSTRVHTVEGGSLPVELTVVERGSGRPVLLLHGGAGLDSVASLAERLAAEGPARVLTPVHPGFGGTPRPAHLDSVRALADVYRRWLEDADLRDVLVIGSSIGGWIAAELALIAPQRIGALVLIDAAGIQSRAHPMADFFSLSLDQVFELSFAHPDAYRINLATLTDAQRAIAAGNRAALAAYGGTTMADPTLAGRLSEMTVPTLLVWGEADRMCTPEYGREYAAAIPDARFELIADAGHLPQLEQPDKLIQVLTAFTETPRRGYAAASNPSSAAP